MTFRDNGEADASAGVRQELRLDPGGIATYDEPTPGAGETGLPYTISGDGDIVEIGGDADGFINDSLDFISLLGAEEVENAPLTSRLDRTLMVRLPDSQLSIAGKRYRLMSVYTRLDLGAIVVRPSVLAHLGSTRS